MSDTSCPIPTPEQRKFMDFQEAAEKAMLGTIYKAIEDAATFMAENVQAAKIDIPPTDHDYFMAAAQQVLFVRLCGGDPETFAGGDPEVGQHIVDNGQRIIDHYWRGGGAET